MLPTNSLKISDISPNFKYYFCLGYIYDFSVMHVKPEEN